MAGSRGGASDVWVARIDDEGRLLWSRCLGGTGADTCRGLVATAEGFALAGDTTSPDGDFCPGPPETQQRAWAARLDGAGTITGLSQFASPAAARPSDARGGLRSTADGGIILAGMVSDGAYQYAWAVKFDAQLQEQWQTRLAANSGQAFAYDVAQKADGDYLLCGFTEFGAGAFAGQGYHGGNDGFVFVLARDTGAVVAGRCYGGSGDDTCTGVVPTVDGGFYVVGATGSLDGDCPATRGSLDLMLLKVRPDFSLEWARNAGGSAFEGSGRGQLAADGGLRFFGTTASTDGDVTGHPAALANLDLWCGGLDAGGSLLWERCFGGTEDDVATTFVSAPDGGYLLGGYGLSRDGDLADTGHQLGGTDFILRRERTRPGP